MHIQCARQPWRHAGVRRRGCTPQQPITPLPPSQLAGPVPAVRTPVRLRAAAASGCPALSGSPARGRGGARGGRHPLPRATTRVAAAEAREAALDLGEARGAVARGHAPLQLAHVQTLGLAHVG